MVILNNMSVSCYQKFWQTRSSFPQLSPSPLPHVMESGLPLHSETLGGFRWTYCHTTDFFSIWRQKYFIPHIFTQDFAWPLVIPSPHQHHQYNNNKQTNNLMSSWFIRVQCRLPVCLCDSPLTTGWMLLRLPWWAIVKALYLAGRREHMSWIR